MFLGKSLVFHLYGYLDVLMFCRTGLQIREIISIISLTAGWEWRFLGASAIWRRPTKGGPFADDWEENFQGPSVAGPWNYIDNWLR
jgi:hypothetical protein